MRFRLQPPLVLEADTPMGERGIRALLALWRAALLSAAVFFVARGRDYMEFRESPMAPAYQVALQAASGLEWLPYQVGRAVPALKAPSEVSFNCGLGRLDPIPMATGGADLGPPAPHILIGNFYLVWSSFFQHMLGSTLTYFIVFLGLAELRMRWRRWREARAPR